MRSCSIIMLLACAACEHSALPGGGPRDQGSSDLAGSGADLAVVIPPDLAGPFCAGTRVAGTCAQAFFGAAWLCFMPAGQCQSAPNGFGDSSYCWANGARLLYSGGSSHFRDWTSNNRHCLGGSATNQNGYFYDGNQALSFDEASGDVTCVDGSKVNIGANFSGCAELKRLLSPPSPAECPPGAC